MASRAPPVDPSIYRLLVEQAKDYAVFILHPDGRVMTWNIGAERIKGYAPDEIIGRHFSAFYTRDAIERGWPAHELKMAAAEGVFEDEGWRVRKDGERFWARVETWTSDAIGASLGSGAYRLSIQSGERVAGVAAGSCLRPSPRCSRS